MPKFDKAWFLQRCIVNPNTNCWDWQLSDDGTGGGVIGHHGKTLKASRVAFENLVGPIPKNLVVRHTCDNRACCNPQHLMLGTQADNMQDMTSRGRQAAGSKNGMSKLCITAIVEIRSSKLSRQELAALHDITYSMVCKIINRKTWRHV